MEGAQPKELLGRQRPRHPSSPAPAASSQASSSVVAIPATADTRRLLSLGLWATHHLRTYGGAGEGREECHSSRTPGGSICLGVCIPHRQSFLRGVPTIVHLIFPRTLNISRYVYTLYIFAESINETTNWKVDFKNHERSQISPPYKLTSQLATVSWILTGDMRLLETDLKTVTHSKSSS